MKSEVIIPTLVIKIINKTFSFIEIRNIHL
jgi:hypothetical protein